MSFVDVNLVNQPGASSSFTTDPIDLKGYTFLSVQAGFTGTIAGTFYIELSNDKYTWFRFADADQTISSPQNAMTEISGVGTLYARAGVSIDSGSGDVSIIFGKKGQY